MLDLNAMLVFAAIAEERSFSRAAQQLGIVQSVASKRLARLEDQIGARLIDRSLRSDIRLTRTGQMLLPQIQDVLARLCKTQRAGINLARGHAGPLRIGFVFSAALNGTLPAILRTLRSALPNLTLEPKLMETPEQIAELESGGIDVGLVRPRLSYPAGCTDIVVHQDCVVACLSLDHPLAGSDSLAPSQLHGCPFILPQFHEDVGLIDSLRSLARAGNFPMPEIIRTGDFVTAACLASTGDGIVLAPASLSKLSIEDVVFRPFVDFDERLQTIMVLRDDAPDAAAAVLSAFAKSTDALERA